MLPEFSSRLATYADRWNQAFDALKIETLRDFVKEHPSVEDALEGDALKQLDADGRQDALCTSCSPSSCRSRAATPTRHARLKLLKRKAADASAASYRAEVRLGAVLRLRTLLTSMAGRVYMTTRATAEERAAFERLAACQDLALGGVARCRRAGRARLRARASRRSPRSAGSSRS